MLMVIVNKLEMHYFLEPDDNDEMSLIISKVNIRLLYLDDEKTQKIDKTIYVIGNDIRYLEGEDLTLIDNDKLMLKYQVNYRIVFELNNIDLGYVTKRTENGIEIPDYNFSFNSKPSDIHFISADRIGPKEFYFKSPLFEHPNVGTKGEFTVNLLDKLAQELVNESLCLGDDAKTLITQTQAWLGKILNPLKLEVPRSKTNILELFIGDSKPSNVGFGYSSVLPIIVTGLIAKPGEKIIIENPEIHLHPKAQSALIEFLVKVANTGVQIFIESHSDHVLNALRLATKEKVLSTEETSILFFNKNVADNSTEVTSILIDEKGKLHKKTSDGMTTKIPKGFFDEWTNSMAKLF
jgi:predicted ATPase